MKEYELLEAKKLSQEDIEQAIVRAHHMRSEYTWSLFRTVATKVRNMFSHDASGSGLAHSS